ncbi:aminotransferase class V-fold PLP-dependent enzyme [Candidatus Pelagibacter sp.]|jgi:perosamine synthetase|nr:aminotransferase class V-fold PLP-dependent enzyme [Candidatus Pelagibacter sp.]
MKTNFTDFPLMETKKKSFPLFYPYVSKKSIKSIPNVLKTRWVGQGPLVDKFENIFKNKFAKTNHCVAVGSGTDALHLAYILANIKKNDEVIAPVFTCTATNIPLLYIGAKIKFADIDPQTMNISIDHVKKLVTKKTKAIIFVNYGGVPCDLLELNKLKKKYKLILIQDAAQSLGSKVGNKDITDFADFTIFSFQAIKHITSGDGGMLTFKDEKLLEKSRRIRWFGIDREKKQGGTWENDITEIGYKYQMTDIGARMLLDSIQDFSKIFSHRRKIFNIYKKELSKNKNIKVIDTTNKSLTNSYWLCTIILKKNRIKLQNYLRKLKIETNQVHFRNDRYKIFKKFVKNSKFPIMKKYENNYLVIPLNIKISTNDAYYIAKSINNFFIDENN